MTDQPQLGDIRPADDAPGCRKLWNAPKPEIHTGSTFFDDFPRAMAKSTPIVHGTPAELAALTALALLVTDLKTLISESDGVAGLHLNGDLAPWQELLPDGRYPHLDSLALAEAILGSKGWPT